jgi:hypothetical protein
MSVSLKLDRRRFLVLAGATGLVLEPVWMC